jgi:hypothetical protein
MSWWRILATLGAALNIVDAVATCIEIEHGLAHEANPVMALVYVFGVPMFFAVKFLAALLFLWLGHNEKHQLARVGLAALVLSYCGVFAVHFWGLL